MPGIKSFIKRFLKKNEDERVDDVAPVLNEVVDEVGKQVEKDVVQDVVDPVVEVEPAKPELDAAAKKRIKNEYKKGHKQVTQSELFDLYISLVRHHKLSRAKGEQKLSKDRKAVTKLSSAWIVRLERLLKGESFEDVQAEVDGLYAAQTELYRKKLNELLTERSNMTEDEIERQQEEYNNILKLIKENQYSLSKEEKEKIYLLYKEIKQEERAVLLTRNYESELKDETLLSDKSWAYIVKTIELGLKEPRYITIEDDIKWLRQKIVENKDNSQKYYRIAINRHQLFEHFDEVEELISELYQKAHADGKKIELVIDDDGTQKQKRKYIVAPYNYTEEELDTLYSVNWKVDKLYFSEFYPQGPLPFDKNRLWTYDEVRHANYWKNKNIEKIEKMDLSPFEKVLLVHHIVTKGEYQSVDINVTNDFEDLRRPQKEAIKNFQQSTKNKDLDVNMGLVSVERSRTFLTGEDSTVASSQPDLKRQHKGFVCCGFASHAKAYMDTLNDPNIQCEFMGVSFYNKKTGEKRSSHLVLKVTIKDDEYDMQGEYVWDPCWDSNMRGFAFCLFPMDDYLHYRDDKEIVKVELSEELTTEKAILASNLPTRIDPNDNRLVLDNPNVKPSQPIPFVTFHKGLYNLAKKANETEGGYYLPKDFVTSTKTNSIHNLASFDPEQAKNAFYADMRDYYIENIKEYPDWQTNFTKYNKGIEYTS